MNKRTVIALIISGLLVILGIGMLLGAFFAGGSELKALSAEEREMNTYGITETFDKISINTDVADVAFVKTDDGSCRVECHDRKRMKHVVAVEDGTLYVKLEDGRKWYDHISFFSFGEDKVTVYLTNGEYESLAVKNSTGDVTLPNSFAFGEIDITLSTGDVRCSASAKGLIKIKSSTGYIRVEGASAGSMELRTSTGNIKVNNVTCTGDMRACVSTGKTELANVSCANLYSEGNTGDITLDNVIASGTFDIERSTGGVELVACDAAAIKIETDTGDVKGTLLSEKIFAASSDTGSVRVPASNAGGLCEIETDTGSIKIEIVK